MQDNRPTGVSVIAVLSFLGGISNIVAGLGLLFAPIPGQVAALATPFIVLGLVFVALGAFHIAVGWGLWELKNWARIVEIILRALSLIQFLVLGAIFLFGVDLSGIAPGLGLGRLSFPGYGIALWILAAIPGIIVWYLLKPDVERLFVAEDYYPPPVSPPPMEPYPPLDATEVASPPPPPPPPAAPSPRPVQRTAMVDPQPPAVGWLVLRSGTRPDKQFNLSTSARNTIGRDGRRCEVILDDPTVSAEHAVVQWENGQFVVYDLASRNGTFVNDARVQRQTLLDGDVLRLGKVVLVLKWVR